MISDFKVNDKVTVITTIEDPSHLAVRPRVFVVEIRYDQEGPVYFVGHPGEGLFAPTRFGPFAAEKLKRGW